MECRGIRTRQGSITFGGVRLIGTTCRSFPPAIAELWSVTAVLPSVCDLARRRIERLRSRHCAREGGMVRSVGANLKGLPISRRRVAAMAVAAGCHVGLLMVLLQPAAGVVSSANVMKDPATLLKVRFISTPGATPPLSTAQAPQPARRRSALASEPMRRPPRRTRPVVASSKTRSFLVPNQAQAAALSLVTTVLPEPGAVRLPVAALTSTGNGGFRERLENLQHASGVRGVPGSDAPFVPGIKLADPMDQGVGAVMRSTQRLFGIPDRHCIDVEVWQSLSPDELIARHLSPADVRREGDNYNCNRPLGLNF